MRKSEIISSFIWLPMTIIVTFLSITAVYFMLNSIETPKEFENTVVGSKELVIKNIVYYADQCWRMNVYSRLEQNEDCFLLHVVSDEYISKDDILSNVNEKLHANDLIVETNIEKDKLYNLGVRFELTQKKIRIINVDKTTPDTIGPTIYDISIEPQQSDKSTFITARSNDSSGVVNETFAVHFILNENVVESKQLYNDGDNDLDGIGTDSNDSIANDATFSNIIYMEGKPQGAYDVLFTADDNYGNTGSFLIEEGFINCQKDLKWNGTECMVCIDDGVCKEGECVAGCRDCSVTLCCGTGLSDTCDEAVGENCQICTSDCKPIKQNQKEGEKCSCDAECSSPLLCDLTGHCCPLGYEYDNGKCVEAKADLLVVAIKENMNVFRDDDVKALELKIKEYLMAVRKNGLNARFLYLDGDETSNIIGSKLEKSDAKDFNKIDGILEQLESKLEVKYLLIVGGTGRFPQGKVGSDETDDIYGDWGNTDRGFKKDTSPDIPVGRIPDPTNGDITLLMNAFDTFIRVHNAGGLDLSNYQENSLTPKYYNTHECFALKVIGKKCEDDPKCNYGSGASIASGKSFFYHTGHGINSHPQSYPSLGLTPSGLNSLNVKDATWMMVPCYGGIISIYSTTSESIPMTFFKKNGAVFFASTHLNCCEGTSSSVCSSEDNGVGSLYIRIGKEIKLGTRIGDAFVKGKQAFGGTKHQSHINQFYGDPTLKVKSKW